MTKTAKNDTSLFKTILILSGLCLFSALLIVISYKVYQSRQAYICEQFEKQFEQVKAGDTRESVENILGFPSTIRYESSPNRDTYLNYDLISGATMGSFVNIWDYEIVSNIYSVYFRPESRGSEKWIVYAREYPDKDIEILFK